LIFQILEITIKRMKLLFILLVSQSVLEVGQKYLTQKEFDKAYAIFHQIYTVSKNTPEGNWARYYLSLSLLGSGDTLSALGNLLKLKEETCDDSLAYLIYQKIIELSQTQEDSLRWISEMVNLSPSSANRKRIVEETLNKPVGEPIKIGLLRILASDYESRKSEISLGEALLKDNPGASLILAERNNASLLKIKALYRNGNYIDFYRQLIENNPQKIIPEEAIDFLLFAKNSPKITGLLFALEPENEKTAFEFSRILEKMGLPSTKFRKKLKDKLYISWLNIKQLTIQDLEAVEGLPPSPLRDLILTKGYIKEKWYAKSLFYATQLPDSFEYNITKLELADSMIQSGIITPELSQLLMSIQNFYPLTERDKRLLVIKSHRGEDVMSLQRKLETNLVKADLKIPVRFESPDPPDTEVIKTLYKNFDFEGVIKYSRGKTLPYSMKYYVANSLLHIGAFEEALNILEDEPSTFPGIYIRALAGVDNPTNYLKKIPLNLEDDDAYCLFVIATKTSTPELFDFYSSRAFRFYKALLKEDLYAACTLVDSQDSRMVLELVKALSKEGQYEKIVEITKNANPFYPLEQEIFTYRLQALYKLGLYQKVLNEGIKYYTILENPYANDITCLSALETKNLNLAFLFSLGGDTPTSRNVYSRSLLYSGLVELVEPNDLTGKDLLLYYYSKKNLKALESCKVEKADEAFLKLKLLTILAGTLPDSLLKIYSDTFQLSIETRYVLKGHELLIKNQLDSLSLFIDATGLEDPELTYEMALRLITSGEMDMASQKLKDVLDISNDSLRHEIYFRLGNIEAAKGNFGDAIFYYSKANTYGNTFEKELLYNLAVSYKNSMQLDSALQYFKILRTKYSYHEISIEASIFLGYLMVENQKDDEKAIEILKEVIGIGTKAQDCEALYWLSRGYLSTQDLRSALASLKRIYNYYTELADWRDTAKLDAAKIFVYLNHRDIAKNLYDEVIKTRGKDDPLSQEALSQKEFFKL